jgi:hypothetical protein
MTSVTETVRWGPGIPPKVMCETAFEEGIFLLGVLVRV